MLNSVKHEPETYTLHMYIIDINAGHANGEIIEYIYIYMSSLIKIKKSETPRKST